MDVVLDVKPLGTSSSSGTSLGDVAIEPVLGALDLVGRVLVVVIGVDVEVDDVVAEISHVSLALTGAAGVGGTHVGGNLANDVAESHLVLDHLGLAVFLRDCAQVQVSPGVGSKLVTLRVHTLEDVNKLGGDVYLTLVDVVAGNEEGSLCVVLLHQVQYMRCEGLRRAVIVGKSDSSWLHTAIDSCATIRNVSNLGPGDGGRIGATRCLVLRAAWAVLVVAAWRVAEVVISAAVCCLSVYATT